MALYEIEMEPEAQDPQAWADCRIIRRRTRTLSVDRYLVEMSQDTAERTRGLPGVLTVEPAVDGGYVDDNRRTYVVRGGQVVDVL
jgi:hypothetical protein